MAEPVLTFAASHNTGGGADTPWGYDGIGNDPDINGWIGITPATDLVVFTGGGILGALPTPTTFSGARDATIRPTTASYVIPQTYIEKADRPFNEAMCIAQHAGHNANRYAMAVHIFDHMTSDLYLEAWDDHSFSTTNLEILAGTPNSNNQSFVNAIRTTEFEPPWDDTQREPGGGAVGWDGSDVGAAYLRGIESRIGLGNKVTLENEIVYYNIYIRLETDCSTFHATPVLGFRYLYT